MRVSKDERDAAFPTCAILGSADPGRTMPFVRIRLIETRSQQQKDEIAKRVNDAISDVSQLPNDIWVVLKISRLRLVCRRDDGRRTPQKKHTK